ncbi:MAG: hypothetical protein ABL961_05925 [Vicinamibacterales bacterium]
MEGVLSSQPPRSADPIVVVDDHSFYSLEYSAPPSLATRLVFLTGPNVLASRMAAEMHTATVGTIADYDTLLASRSSFLLYDSELSASRVGTPLLPRLIHEGWQFADAGCLDGRDLHPRPGALYEVSRTGSALRSQ